MKNIKFDSLLTHCLGDVEIDEKSNALFNLAWNLDSLQVRIRDGAEYMAERFARYAREVGEGDVRPAPTGWSTLNELTEMAAEHRAKLDAFKAFFEVVTGRKLAEAVAEFRAAQTAKVAS
jgi:hypothetical protein